jgi:3-oxoacyl-[acyl-carrier protein] reductase
MNHLLTTPFSSFEDIFKINMGGTFLLTRELGKIMASQKQGSIINFTSIAVPLNLEGESLYAASKAAVSNFTQTAASELGKFNIRVNAIGPVPIETDLIRNVPKQKIQELIDRQIIKRLGNFEDVANVVDFFASDKSSFITGQVIYLGGIHG